MKWWLKYIDLYRHHRYFDGDDTLVKMLARVSGKEELMKHFVLLRDVPGMQHRAGSLQRSLAAVYPDSLPLMMDMWLEVKVSPNDAYDMIPIRKEDVIRRGVK